MCAPLSLNFPPMPSQTFELEGEYVELNQLLKLAGIAASGGEGKHLVAEGLVTVDGVVEWRKTCKIRAGQVVAIDDEVIRVV
jgi:ribosome-associated protein